MIGLFSAGIGAGNGGGGPGVRRALFDGEGTAMTTAVVDDFDLDIRIGEGGGSAPASVTEVRCPTEVTGCCSDDICTGPH